MGGHYILVGHTAVPCSMMEWARQFEKIDRHVADSNVGMFRVSTIFLGLDHNFVGGPPQIFETMVFCPTLGHGDLYCERYATWEEAERGHASAVAWVQAGKAYRPAAAAAWDNVKWRVRVAWRRFWRVARGVTKQ